MLNFNLMKAWQNWIIIFLMISIAMTGLHIFINFIDKDTN